MGATTAALVQLLGPAKGASASATASPAAGARAVSVASSGSLGARAASAAPSCSPGTRTASRGEGSPVPRPSTAALQAAVARLSPEEFASLCANAQQLRNALSLERPLGHSRLLDELGLHRIVSGLRSGDASTKSKHFDYFVQTEGEERFVLQRVPAASAAATAARAAIGGGAAAAGGAGAPVPGADARSLGGIALPVAGASTFVIASASPEVKLAAHKFMSALSRSLDPEPCVRLHTLPGDRDRLSLWLDDVLAEVVVNGTVIPIIFHVTVACADERMARADYLWAVWRRLEDNSMCCIAAAAEPQTPALPPPPSPTDAVPSTPPAVRQLLLPPPTFTDTLMSSFATKPAARHACASDPGSCTTSVGSSGASVTPPRALVRSPMHALQLFVP